MQCLFDEDEEAGLLPGLTALQSLTCIDSNFSNAPPCFAQLLQLPCLQRLTLKDEDDGWCHERCLGLSGLPADMGSLSATLIHLDISGRKLTHFPLALTRLVALECLKASANEFAKVPDGITALARLTKLTLGRAATWEDPLQLHEKRPLDVRALGDLSAFPALCKLTFKFCEVAMCESMLGAVRHASLASLVFRTAHPAPGCMLTVLQLSQALKQQMRGSVLRLVLDKKDVHATFLHDAQGQAPFHKFRGGLAGVWQVRCSDAGHACGGVHGLSCPLHTMCCAVCAAPPDVLLPARRRCTCARV